MPATIHEEYDEIVSTMKLEHRDKQPASPANMTDYYNVVASDVVPKASYQCTPHTVSHDTPLPYVNVHSSTHNEPSQSRTSGEEDKSNNRNLVMFDDPSYGMLPHIQNQ